MSETIRLIRFDSIGGASGDMLLAGMLGLGVALPDIESNLSKLNIGRISLKLEKATDRGISGNRLTVITEHSHAHRHIEDIEKILTSSQISPDVTRMTMSIFRKLAEAEAKIHGTTPDKIHFHEVGAADSIADIVGTCIAICKLNINAVHISPLPIGQGFITCEHGILPVPVPATVELLKNMQIIPTDEPNEMVTPTAAAVLSFMNDEFKCEQKNNFKIIDSSWSIGHKKLSTRTNALRVTLMEYADSAISDQSLVLETNIDDMSPQMFGVLTARLFENGALDVFTTPVFMKKQRPAILLTVICPFEKKESMLDIIFCETTTFGVREYVVNRTTLQRKVITIDTRFGPIRIKIGEWRGRIVTKTPEYEDCVQAAVKNQVTFKMVHEEAIKSFESK